MTAPTTGEQAAKRVDNYLNLVHRYAGKTAPFLIAPDCENVSANPGVIQKHGAEDDNSDKYERLNRYRAYSSLADEEQVFIYSDYWMSFGIGKSDAHQNTHHSQRNDEGLDSAF